MLGAESIVFAFVLASRPGLGPHAPRRSARLLSSVSRDEMLLCWLHKVSAGLDADVWEYAGRPSNDVGSECEQQRQSIEDIEADLAGRDRRIRSRS